VSVDTTTIGHVWGGSYRDDDWNTVEDCVLCDERRTVRKYDGRGWATA